MCALIDWLAENGGERADAAAKAQAIVDDDYINKQTKYELTTSATADVRGDVGRGGAGLTC